MPAWLFALLAAAFVLYTDDYVIAGVLPEIARDLDVTEAHAGQLVTVFSLTVALAAPIAGVALARVSRRYLFTAAFVVFIAANLVAATTNSFGLLVMLRIVAALAAAASTPAVFAFAAERAPQGHIGRYVAVVALGVTGSIAAGVPVGTWLGGHHGWRATFVAMAVGGIAALVFLLVTLPREGDNTGEVPSVCEQLRTLTSAPVSLGLLANCALMTGSMMMLTYMAPYLAEVSEASVDQRALAFSLSGFAGILCIWAGGKATDRWGPDRALVTGIGIFTGIMAVMGLLWFVRPVPFSVLVVMGTIWGGMAFWNSPAIQARLYLLAGPVAAQALALNTSSTYLGVSLGGAVGGLTLGSAGAGLLPAVAAVLGLSALGLLALAIGASRKSPTGADALAPH
ncbi:MULTISPECIES: MFS transporter [Streptomyces]|uniref:MFS transporter n=1 Tax=Streptomyces plicatus TaxID=1922 RepID=A0ABW1Y6R5_STRPL|nr:MULTISPECIES: MFS transporter [Streptomyces]MBJ6622196.1 MFS transporter [Streptomyces sp. DHE17-7]RSS66242.1 MFS transporter [Streptomyces sp. WAC06273]GGZ81962.1 chloramphenicol resistance protein [Streptomyces plicatus]